MQICEDCKIETSPNLRSKKGVIPRGDETQVDHVDPKSNSGSGTLDNGEVWCRAKILRVA